MKNQITSLILLLALLMPVSALAYDFEVDGIYYNKSGTTATVTYETTDYNSYSGDVTIPATVTYGGTTYSVTIIGDLAFRGCTGLTNITIPNSVTSIGEWVFSHCTGLTSVTIPNSVTKIGFCAFYDCTSLTSVNLGNSVKIIDICAFSDCSSLTSVTIPNSVTTIGAGAFGLCTRLSSVNLGNSVKSIGLEAFSGCSGLTSIGIPNSVTHIGESAFSGCSGLNVINVESGNTIFDSRNNCNSIIETASNTLIAGCKATVIPNTVTSIGYGAFWGCSGLTSIDIPNSVTSIGESAFRGCTGLTNITIPNSVTSIGDAAFNGCISLKVLYFNAVSCADFSSSTPPFAGSKISTISISDDVIKIPANFARDISTLSKVTIGNSVTTISSNAFNGCNYLVDLSLGNSVKSIGDSVFYNCSGLTSVTIPPSAREIYNHAFFNCSGLKSLYCYATNPPVMESSDCFNTYNTTTLYVFYPSYNTYNATNWWNQFNIIFATDADGNILVTGIKLNLSSKSVYVNQSFKLTATITPDIATNKTVLWTSSNNAVATVDSDGQVTALAGGTARITATTTDGSNLSASCDVTVIQLATSISLNETVATMYTGNTLQLSATVLPNTTSNPSVTWSSSNTSVATVSSAGVVTAKSAGEVVITARTTDGTNLSANCNVTVKQLATSIYLNHTSATLYMDQTIQLTATVSPSDATDRSVLWSSSDNSIANVSPTGLVTAIGPGNATITATTVDGSNLSATCAITVKASVTSLTLDPSEVTILEGDTITLTPTILPTYATNQDLYWSSNNTSVATVNNGVVVGRSGGETTITTRTTDGSNLYASCKVTVIPNFDVSAPDISHIRGSSNNKFDLTIDLANRYDITGMQFDLQLPTDVTITQDSDGEFNIWLDDTRKSRNHTVTASLIGYNTYRILVSSATANILKGHSGTVLHIMIEIPISHVSGNKQVKYSNIILSEPDETRHTLPTKYSMISYYYKEGDANADLNVDVADYVITGNYILQNSPENFWYDAANVDHNSTIDVNDLTGITNIALGRREGGILQMPAMQSPEENQDIELTADPLVIQAGQTKTLSLSLEGIYSYAGFQMDIQLPKGIKLAEASLANDNGDFSIANADLPDGSIRLLASSFSLKDITVNDAAFLKLTLTADGNFSGNDVITLDGIKFSERDMALHAIDGFEIPVGNEVSSLEQLYSGIRIYTDGANIVIDSPESGTARIVTIAGITQVREITPGHNVIPMDNSGIYIVTLNGTTAKLYLK